MSSFKRQNNRHGAPSGDAPARPRKQRSTKERTFGVMLLFMVLFLVVIIKLFDLQVVQAEWLQEQATGQWTRSTTVAADRGSITDTNGIVLAQSGTADTIEAAPNEVTDPKGVARACAEILGLDYDTAYERVSDEDRSWVTLKRQVEPEQADALRAYNFKGVYFTVDTKRYYPFKRFLTQVIGYTTIDGIGQDGIEAAYDKYLAGTPGKLVYEKDSSGREIPYGSETYIEPIDGYNIALTVDSVVQSSLERAVENALEVNGAKTAMGIVMNVNTGEVLGITTKPDFDLNDPPRSDYEELQSLSRNRVVADSYEPGSVFKIVTLASALNEGVVTEDSTFDCPGYKIVEGQRIKCWATDHGHQTLAEGVQNSCNPVFMELALRLGNETFYEYLYAFGFGSSTNSGMSGESSGILRDIQYVQSFDLARIGFGQSVAVTAIQMASAASAAVNGGELMQPYIVKEIYTDDGEIITKNEPTVIRRVISEEVSATVREMLVGVVEEGSGKNAAVPGYAIGGKTGTSQKYEDGAIAQGKYISSFLAFAPADDPQFLVYIVVDEPTAGSIYGSTVAAPFAREVLEDLLKYYGVQPSDTAAAEDNVEVPSVSGMSLEAAREALEEAGLTAAADGSSGSVVAQSPLAGATAARGTQVQLYVSEPDEVYDVAPGDVTVPDLSGKTAGAAYAALKELGLTLNAAGEPQGVVVSQNPAAGSAIAPGGSVSVTLGEQEQGQ